MKVIRILGWSLLPFFSGCVMVSMHTSRPVELSVRQKPSGKPVANTKVEVKYSHPRNSGAPYFVVRIPRPVSGRTDAQGRVVLSLSDYSLGPTNASINGSTFTIPDNMVRHGGLTDGGHWGPSVWVHDPVEIQLTPKQ